MKPNAAFLRRHLYREGRLKEHQAMWVIQEATRLMRLEPNLLYVESPVTRKLYAFVICLLMVLPKSRWRHSWAIRKYASQIAEAVINMH